MKVAYQLDTSGSPKLSYRYAFFEGDDPATANNEAFDGLFTGFYDWGKWWQGEIAGEYFVSNSNLISQPAARAHETHESISTGLIFFDFMLDQPGRRASPRTKSRPSSTGTWTGRSTTTSW